MVFTINTKINSTAVSANDEFGSSVYIDGYYAVVGSPQENSGRGSIFIFKKREDGTWSFLKKFISPVSSENNFFGYRVAIQKNYIIVGEYGSNSSTGTIHFFRRLVEDEWVYISSQISPNNSVDDEFGKSIDIFNDYVVVGSPGSNSGQGLAYLFEIVNNILVLRKTFIVADVENNDNVGSDVTVNSNFVIVGSNGKNNNQGIIYVYYKDQGGEDQWGLFDSIISSDISDNDDFGISVSMDNDYLVVGSSNKTSENGEQFAGAVYIFKFITDQWYEIKKIVGKAETSSYEGNNFGSSVFIKGDYLVVGSPGARNSRGVVDIFYRKRGWQYIEKVVSSDGVSGDNFGVSVSIDNEDIIIGASLHDTSSVINSGAAYLFTNSTTVLRLGQEFNVNRKYVPSKASLYLKRVGNNLANYWTIYNDRKNVIDATNFYNLDQKLNKIIFDDRVDGYTGNGYMALANEPTLSILGGTSIHFGILEYPIKAAASDVFDIWLRCRSEESNTFQADILLDNIVVHQINDTVVESEWTWINRRIVLPDTKEHVFGIRLKEKGVILDKIYLDAEIIDEYEGESNTYYAYADGPFYTESPYLTLHLKVYHCKYDEYVLPDFSVPTAPLFIYDYKTTIEEVVHDDWYNFNINILDSRLGWDDTFDFYGNYFLVLSITGYSDTNLVFWQIVDNDEYMSLSSAIRI